MLWRECSFHSVRRANQLFSRPFSLSGSDIWQVLTHHKNVVGPRCLVLSSSNIDQDIQDRMCFELQRRGTQPVKFRIPATPLMVPSLATVSEAVELFRRTGCRSIISIGTGSEADAGKAVRAMLEQQTATSSKSKVKLPHRAPVADSKGNTTVNAVTVPLICMATSISPVHSRGAYGLLHDEEHTVEMRHWRAPDVIATDFDVLSKGHYFSEDAVRCYLIANLFDLLFAVSCSSLSAAFDDSDFNSNYVTSRVEAFTSGESFHRVRGMITTAAGNSDPTDIKETLFALACEIGGAYERLARHDDSISDSLPYVPSLLSPTTTANFLVQRGPSFAPYSFVQITAFQNLFSLLPDRTGASLDGRALDDDDVVNQAVEAAANVARDAFLSLIAEEDVQSIAAAGVSAMKHLLDTKRSNFQPKSARIREAMSGLESISATACLELYSITAQEVMKSIDEASSTAPADSPKNIMKADKIQKQERLIRALLESDLVADINSSTQEELAMII